ncbi:Zinc finger CCHC domain-containing protein 3 [Holothuria leucospilota]|uniref:Zinc finger CCHC domain-containing protein 3 n=1 Tax=Holothuria leucospilota TaxID=206669 RepID=A0A9Q1CSW8_HOLLE|nr:Zinc finger CCHC domain-containing protein 3 [Holothuria leucospilota]
MLQALEARNTYDLKFKSDAARVKGVSCLKGVEGLTVTPYDGSVAVTVLYLAFEVDQRLVARVLSQYGTVSEMRWCKYTVGELKGIFNGKRQFRMELVRDIPSFLFMGGSKALIRYFCQPRTCFRCGEEGHEAKQCPNEVRCNLCGEEGHVFDACPTSYSAHVSADVGSAPEPQTGPQYSTQELEEAALEVEQDFLASKQCEGGLGLLRQTVRHRWQWHPDSLK